MPNAGCMREIMPYYEMNADLIRERCHEEPGWLSGAADDSGPGR